MRRGKKEALNGKDFPPFPWAFRRSYLHLFPPPFRSVALLELLLPFFFSLLPSSGRRSGNAISDRIISFFPPPPLLPSSALPLSPLPFFVCVGRSVLLCVGRKERVGGGGGQSSSSCSNFFLFCPCLATGVKRELKGRSHALFCP